MGFLDALRKLANFRSLDKIKNAIDRLSQEEFMQLLEYMEGLNEAYYAQFQDVTADPNQGDGKVWY